MGLEDILKETWTAVYQSLIWILAQNRQLVSMASSSLMTLVNAFEDYFSYTNAQLIYVQVHYYSCPGFLPLVVAKPDPFVLGL